MGRILGIDYGDSRIGLAISDTNKIIASPFKTIKNTACPYCRSGNNLLPLVNGLKKVFNGIHDMDEWGTYENKKCLHILKKGKNKGKQCSKNCHIGMDYCLIHNKKHKESIGNNSSDNGNNQ